MEKNYVFFYMPFLFQLIACGIVKRTEPSVTLDIPLDFHQRIKVYDDFIQIIKAPSYAEPEFDIVLSYRVKDRRLLILKVTSTGIQNNERTEFEYAVVIVHRTDVTQTLNVTVRLRDALAYLENKALNVVPDLYIEEIHVTVMILEFPFEGLDSKPVLAGDFLRMPLTPPWSRPLKPGFSFSWPWEHAAFNSKQKIEKCQNMNGKFKAQ